MSIRYFATNRSHENLGRDIGRKERLKLQSKGYYWVEMQAYMSHYLATTDPNDMPKSVLVRGDHRDRILDEHFLNHPKIGQIVVCVHGFNVDFHNAQTWFSILTDTLRKTKSLGGKVVTDPIAQDKELLSNSSLPDNSLTAFIGFSWPSNGSALSYPSDQREAVGSGSALANLIAKLHKTTGKSVNLVCHSMGNFLTCHMFKNLIHGGNPPEDLREKHTHLVKRKTDLKDHEPKDQFFVDRYVMLAPDVERRHVTKCVADAANLGQDDEEATYLGQFYSGLEHLVGQVHNFYSRFDGALALSNIEKGPRKAAVATKGIFDALTFGMLEFLERNPDEKWEQRLGATQHPMIAPPNMTSHNAVELSGREIGHSDYIDNQEISEKIATVLTQKL